MGKFNPLTFIVGAALTAVGLVTGVGILSAVGLSLIAGSFGPNIQNQRQFFEATSPNPARYVPVVYGKQRLAIQPADFPVSGKFLYMPGMLCTGSRGGRGIEAIDEIEIDGKLAVAANTFGVGGLTNQGVLSPFDGSFRYAKYLGTTTQTVDATLNSKFATTWPTTSAGAGICYLLGEAKDNVEVFPSKPTITAVVRGRQVFDPRTSIWAWSDNPALCVRDFLLDPISGLGVEGDMIDEPSFIELADFFDELVSVPDGAGGSTTQKRKRCNATLSGEVEAVRNLEILESSFGGRVIFQGGLFRIDVRRLKAVSGFVVDEDDIVGDFAWKMAGLRDGANMLDVSWVDADNNWQVDTFRWPEPDGEGPFLDADGGFPAISSLELPAVTDRYQARRMADQLLKELRAGDTMECVVKERALVLEVFDIVAVNQAALGDEAPTDMWVMDMGHLSNGLIRLSLMRYDPTAYDSATLVDVGNEPANPNLPDPDNPSNLTNYTCGAVVSCTTPVSPLVRLSAGWTGPNSAFDDGVILRWREDGAPGPWNLVRLPRGVTSWDQQIEPEGAVYRVEALPVNGRGVTPDGTLTEVTISAIPWTNSCAVTLRTILPAPSGTPIVAGDITLSEGSGTVTVDVDAAGSNGGIFTLHQGTSGFTPGVANKKSQTFTADGRPIFQFVPDVAAGTEFCVKVRVQDCLSEALGETATYSAEQCANFNGVGAPPPPPPPGSPGAAVKVGVYTAVQGEFGPQNLAISLNASGFKVVMLDDVLNILKSDPLKLSVDILVFALSDSAIVDASVRALLDDGWPIVMDWINRGETAGTGKTDTLPNNIDLVGTVEVSANDVNEVDITDTSHEITAGFASGRIAYIKDPPGGNAGATDGSLDSGQSFAGVSLADGDPDTVHSGQHAIIAIESGDLDLLSNPINARVVIMPLSTTATQPTGGFEANGDTLIKQAIDWASKGVPQTGTAKGRVSELRTEVLFT